MALVMRRCVIMEIKKLLWVLPHLGAINVAATPICMPDYIINPHYHALARPVDVQGNNHDGRSELEECSAGGRPNARTMGERT